MLAEAKRKSAGFETLRVEPRRLCVIARPLADAGEYKSQLTFDTAESPDAVPGLAVIYGAEVFEVTSWAVHQMCDRLGIQEHYILRCPPDLQANNLNYWLGKSQGPWLIRYRDRVILGVLSVQYTPYGHLELLKAVSEGLSGSSVSLRFKHISDELLYITLGLDDFTIEAGIVPGGGADAFVPTLYILNSEVGQRRVTLSVGVWRRVCDNGLMGVVTYGLEQYHRGIDPGEIGEKISLALASATTGAAGVTGLISSARDTTLPGEPDDIVRDIIRSHRLPSSMRDVVMAAFEREPDKTVFGMVQAFAYAARVLPAPQRLGLEQVAGELLYRRIALDAQGKD